MFLRLTAAGTLLSIFGYYILSATGVEPTLVHQQEAQSYQILLGTIAGLVSLGIGVFSWWAKSIMAKMCKIEETAAEGNKTVVSMLREVGEIKVVQSFTTEAIRELKIDVSKLTDK